MAWELVRLVVERMDERDWSEADLARESGLPQSTVHRIITGKSSDVTGAVADVLAAALGVSAEAILDASGEQVKAIKLAGPGGVPGRPPFRPRRRRGARGGLPVPRLRVAARARTVRVGTPPEEESADADDGAPGRGGDVADDAAMPAWFRPYAERLARLERRLATGLDAADSDTTRPWWLRRRAA